MTTATPDEGDVLALVTTLRVATPPEWSADELEVWRESELLPLTERRELMFDLRIGRQSRAVLESDWLATRDAQVAAKALRGAAEHLRAMTEGVDREGTERWSLQDQDTYSLAIEEAEQALKARADAIERGAS